MRWYNIAHEGTDLSRYQNSSSMNYFEIYSRDGDTYHCTVHIGSTATRRRARYELKWQESVRPKARSGSLIHTAVHYIPICFYLDRAPMRGRQLCKQGHRLYCSNVKCPSYKCCRFGPEHWLGAHWYTVQNWNQVSEYFLEQSTTCCS